jgi:hypothetical protein
MTRCLLAPFVLVRTRLQFKKSPAWTIPQGQVPWLAVLPTRAFDVQTARKLVADWPQRNHAASVSHRKRRIARLAH